MRAKIIMTQKDQNIQNVLEKLRLYGHEPVSLQGLDISEVYPLAQKCYKKFFAQAFWNMSKNSAPEVFVSEIIWRLPQYCGRDGINWAICLVDVLEKSNVDRISKRNPEGSGTKP